MVQERLAKSEKPFDLIFMDIFMPVMDGLEAAANIAALGTDTPIVAMTANIMASDLENYRKHGLPDYVGKPFTSQELWRVLLKYLRPIAEMPLSGELKIENGALNGSGNLHFEKHNTQSGYEDELQQKLRTSFVKHNQTKFMEIAQAIESGDIKLAHRLAHSLKGNAGQISKTKLQSAAAEVEDQLKDGATSISDESLNSLKVELNAALEELGPPPGEPQEKSNVLNVQQARALFEKLGPMLEHINTECVDLLDEIRAIPGAEELAHQIEDYDFESAAVTLAALSENLDSLI